MQCFCCKREVAVGRKAKVRRLPSYDPDCGGPDPAVCRSYRKQATTHWTALCPGCYLALDDFGGAAVIDGQYFTLANKSRGDRAGVLTAAQYHAWQRRAAAKFDPRPGPAPDGA